MTQKQYEILMAVMGECERVTAHAPKTRVDMMPENMALTQLQIEYMYASITVRTN